MNEEEYEVVLNDGTVRRVFIGNEIELEKLLVELLKSEIKSIRKVS